ncbi:hypothetical protein V1517DRAFT_334384 [Lipomyces orientalis]|uniref:Uncharacterized protein n=1 Tax=Lipomyces orientalis TaxID=1233043 RepID=A0ACC3TDL4_9ASCO
MARVLKTKACDACAMAKRRCGKQTPDCLRCRRRGIECTYPPAKPTSFVLCGGDDTFSVEHDILPYITPQLCAYSPGFQTTAADDTRLPLGLDLPGLSSALVDNQLASSWFTSIDTWTIDHVPQAENDSFRIIDLERHIITIHRWLTQWVEKGSNPFIHSRLYRTRFPRCVQDAYTALSCYVHKTASNKHTIFQIIEDRAKQLLVEHGVISADSSLENISTSSVNLDSLEHVARVQALLVYQVLGLYDGDIRLRHLAESHIPVLNSWMQQMVEHASQAVCLGGSVISSAHEQTAVGFSLSKNLLWYSWILAESIRRTWVVASGIQGIYLMIQQGRGVHCQGGMMFTTRQGVWEAESALAWEKLCSEVNVGLLQIAEADKLFTEVAPEDVNDFAKLMLEVAFGIERMERWGV